MATYGIDIYGSVLYGSAAVVALTAALRTDVLDYGTVHVTWEPPNGGWSQLRLVRNPSGYPRTITDGMTLVAQEEGVANQIYIDTDVASARRYYYSVFLFAPATQEWIRAGDSDALVVADHGYTDALWDRLPHVYKVSDPAHPADDVIGNEALYRFLSLFGYQLDALRTQYDSLLDLPSAARVAASVLPTLLAQFGFEHEPALGTRTSRLLAQHAPGLYSAKGTVATAENIATLITGWDAVLRLSRNRLLDSCDAFTAQSVGRWRTSLTNATLTAQPASSVGAPLYGAGYAIMRSIRAGSMSASVASPGRAGRLHSVPVVQGRHYAASVYARGSANVRVSIDWYDKSGAWVSSSTGGSQISQQEGWVTRPHVTDIAPRGAMYAAMRVSADVTSPDPADSAGGGREIHLNAAQFEDGPEVRDWQGARAITVVLMPELVNEIVNPRGSWGVQGWAVDSALSTGIDGFIYTWGA